MVDNRKFIVTLDNTIGQGRTSGNVNIMNNILRVLRDAGLNAVDGGIGPNRWTTQVRSNKRSSNTVIVGFCNGSDAGVVEEATNNYGYNRTSKKLTEESEVAVNYKNRKGEIFRGGKDNEFHGRWGFLHNVNKYGVGTDRNNDLILCFFYNAKDFYNPGGEYYEWLVRAHDDNYSPRKADGSKFTGTAYPRKWMEDYDIKMVYNKGDYTGTATAQKVVALINGESETPSPTPTPSVEDTSTEDNNSSSDSTKTITKKVVKQIYKVPWYEKILTTKTDSNGAFLIQQPKDMTIKGEYLVNLYFAGDATHEACNRSIRIQKFSGDVVNEVLLYSSTTEYYSDGSSQETLKTGIEPTGNAIKTKTVTITYTYDNGVLKNTDIKTVLNYKIIEKAEEAPNIISTVDPNTSEVNNNTPTNTKGADPFSNDMALLSDGKPDVANMSTGGKGYVMYDDTRSYTLSTAQFQEVYYRDSKSLQLNNYKVSKYTAFQSTDSDTYNVIPRMEWNPVVQAVHHWLVAHNGASWPSEIKVDFANLRVTINGKNIAFTGKEREYHVVTDHQDNTSTTYGTCGPTSASMTTQWFYNYVSEVKIKNESGHGYGGVGPAGLVKALNKHNFNARQVSGGSNLRAALMSGKALVFHEYGHYCCCYDINNAGTNILFSNPGGSYGGLGSGWHSYNSVNNKGIGGHVVPTLTWTISEAEKQKIQHFYTSMGGAWSRPDNNGRLLPYVYNGG